MADQKMLMAINNLTHRREDLILETQHIKQQYEAGAQELDMIIEEVRAIRRQIHLIDKLVKQIKSIPGVV